MRNGRAITLLIFELLAVYFLSVSLKAAEMAPMPSGYSMSLTWQDQKAANGVFPRMFIDNSSIAITIQGGQYPPPEDVSTSCRATTIEEIMACRKMRTQQNFVLNPKAYIGVIFSKAGGEWKCSRENMQRGMRYKLCATVKVLGGGRYVVGYEFFRLLDKSGDIRRLVNFEIAVGQNGCKVTLLSAARSYQDAPSIMVPLTKVMGGVCWPSL